MSRPVRRPFGEIGNYNAQSRPVDPSMCQSNSGPVANELNCEHLKVTDLCKDAFDYLKMSESLRRPTTDYMTTLQTDVNEKMRCILVDWLVDVHLKFKLLPETLFLAVEIIDRFLDKKIVNRQKLQLVGVVAMLLASKYEEIYPPEVKDFIYIAANTYTRDDILRMERLVFQTLDFNITVPTVYVFLKRGLQLTEVDQRKSHLALFLAELSLTEYSMLSFLPSLLAASCIYIANKALGMYPCWSAILEEDFGYPYAALQSCSKIIVQLLRDAPHLKTQAIRKKYGYSKFSEVSKLPSLEYIQLP